MSIVALDLGSTSVKAVVILDDGRVAHEPLTWPMPAPEPGPDDSHETLTTPVLDAVTELVAAVAQHPSAPSELRVSGQMGGYISPFSRGNPRLVSWQDRRGERPLSGSGPRSSEVLLERLGSGWREASGVWMKPGLPLSNLWHDDLAGGLPDGSDYQTLGAFLVERWCGVNAVERTQAAASGMLDTSTGEWNPAAIAAFEGRLAMPELVDHGVEIGITEFGGRRLAVHPEVGDHHAAVAGALGEQGLGLDADAVTITIGTAGLAARAVSERIPRLDREVRPFFGGWLDVVTRQPGGWQLASLATAIEERVSAVTGEPVDPGDLWSAVDEVVFTTGIADAFAGAYERAVALLLDGRDAALVIHTGGVLDRNARLRGHIDARIGAPSLGASGEATLIGLGHLARASTLKGTA